MKYIFLILFIVLQFVVLAQPLEKEKIKQLDKLLKEQLNTKVAPGLAIGIVRNGEIVYEKYAGYSNIKSKTRLDENSRFNYASSGKQFTAFAILNLIENSKIKLSDDIRKFFPDFYPDIQEEIQIQHLLNHTSGIRDIYELWALQGITWWQESFDNEDAIKLIAEQEQLSFRPGEKYIYSNSNYILLTEIVKKVTSLPFKDYSKNLFDQLGMFNTAFESNHKDIPNRVLPYGFWKKYQEYPWNSDLIGDGALFTTLPDQLIWEKTVQAKASNSFSRETLITSQQPIQSAYFKKYGYGLEFGEDRSFHHGSTGAYGATFARYPQEKLSIVVMTNYTNISTPSIEEKCFEILTGNKAKKAQRSPQKIGDFVSVDSLLGTYKTPFGYYYRFVIKSDTLFLERTNREPVALEHERGNIYHEIKDPSFQQEFTTHPELGKQITAYYPTHDPYTLTKKEVAWDGYDFKKITGTYRSTELGSKLEIRHLNNAQYEVKFNKDKIIVESFEPGIIWYNGYKAEYGIHDSKEGLFISGGRNRNILFIKVE